MGSLDFLVEQGKLSPLRASVLEMYWIANMLIEFRKDGWKNPCIYVSGDDLTKWQGQLNALKAMNDDNPAKKEQNLKEVYRVSKFLGLRY